VDGAAARRFLKMWHSRELLQTVGMVDGGSSTESQPPIRTAGHSAVCTERTPP